MSPDLILYEVHYGGVSNPIVLATRLFHPNPVAAMPSPHAAFPMPVPPPVMIATRSFSRTARLLEPAPNTCALPLYFELVEGRHASRRGSTAPGRTTG